MSFVKHFDGSSSLRFTGPRLVRSMSTLDRSPLFESRDSTKAMIPPSPSPFSNPTPKRNQKKALAHKSDNCQFCVSGPSSSFQLEDQQPGPILPDIKSFSLPRASQDPVAKINERYLEPTNSRKTFKNGTLTTDFQCIQMKNISDTE